MKTEKTCPLGSKCEEARDGILYECAWHTEIIGKHPQSGKDIHSKECAMKWMPLLAVENNMAQRAVTDSLETARVQSVERQDIALEIAARRLVNDEKNDTAERLRIGRDNNGHSAVGITSERNQ